MIKKSGVKSTLYEARQPPVQSNSGAVELFESLREAHSQLGFNHVFSETESSVPTKINTKVPPGSILSYQLSLTEGNCQVITNFPPALPKLVGNSDDLFPPLPCKQVASVSFTGPLSTEAEAFLQNLSVSNPSEVESTTRGQSDNPAWFSTRKNRLTRSNFGVICKCKKALSQEKCVRSTLLNQKDIAHLPAIQYGLSNESTAVGTYLEYMKYTHPVTVLECGTVISPTMQWISSSPDRKVIDQEHGPGLLEVKCPFSLRHLKPEDACKEPGFFCELVDGSPLLKRSHNYYYQVQGQLGVCGLTWCDFVVYFPKGLIIERIEFDEMFWKSMVTTLTDFYHKHVLPVLVNDD